MSYMQFDWHWRACSEALGTLEEGCTDDLAWTWSLMAGPQVLEGIGLARALREAPIDASVRWRELLGKVEYSGRAKTGGRSCHVVRVTLREGGVETRFYDAETGLHVQTEGVLALYGNPIQSVITYGDYRCVDGILLPHSIRKEYASLEEVVITLESIEHGAALPATLFDPPSAIRALLDED